MDRWEYRALVLGGIMNPMKPAELEGQLNELGQQGWEALGITSTPSSARVFILLKRRIGGPPQKASKDPWGSW